jgi:hypothetical protein
MRMFGRPALVILGTAATLAATVSAQTADRLTDKDVKTLLEAVDNGRPQG